MPPTSMEDAVYSEAVGSIRSVVVGFLEDSHGEPADNFTNKTPFMEAGLDSLDLMKVRLLLGY